MSKKFRYKCRRIMYKINFKIIIFYASLLITILNTSRISGQIQDHIPLFPINNEIKLNGDWKFKYITSLSVGDDSLFFQPSFDVSQWQEIHVPGHWELQGFDIPKYKEHRKGTGLYRTSFTVPEHFKNRRIFIRFDGVLYAYEVFINGKSVGTWNSSFNAYGFDITDYVDITDTNTLAVRVSSHWKAYLFDIFDAWQLSGIFRDVVIFSTPQFYINDYTVQTFVPNYHTANVFISIETKAHNNEIPDKSMLRVGLFSPNGKKVNEKEMVISSAKSNLKFPVVNPQLWTAETPKLYTLKISLQTNGVNIQNISQKVGIREIKIDGTVFKLNGSPIKLRGVNTHDLVPETGRTLTKDLILKDLLLMKKANVNFIRTSHYPPDRRKLDMCDSLGFYVVCEVPFGFGNDLLKDTTNQKILLDKAATTLLRDKNHPSVIIWSIGNENPMTQITEVTGNFVKEKDPSRPICFPGYQPGNPDEVPKCVDLFSPHYRSAEWIERVQKETDRPVILTEYAHSLGLSFGNMGDDWRALFRNKSFIGGGVWHFQDQGILQKAKTPIHKNDFTCDVWIDSVNHYKTTLNGADGIVYADRTPQADYWMVRKLYSPVQIVESELKVSPNDKFLNLSFYNQYNFTNLNVLSGEWTLFKNKQIYKQGNIKIVCNPHDTVICQLPCSFKHNLNDNVWYLEFKFSDKNNQAVYEHSVRLVTLEGFKRVKEVILSDLKSSKIKVENKKADPITLATKNISFVVGKNDLSLNISAKEQSFSLIADGIYARAGRKPNMSDITVRDKFTPGTLDYLWEPFLLKAAQVEKMLIEKNKGNYTISGKGTFFRGGKFPEQQIQGEIQYAVKKSGALRVSYHLKPINVSGAFLDAGVSFQLAPEIESFYWTGRGPYPSYPDKIDYANFGFHQIHKDDIDFDGNRSEVDVAVLTDEKGNGIVILPENGNVSVERIDGKIIVSHNAIVLGVGRKKYMPRKMTWAKDIAEIKGEFIIIPLVNGECPDKLKELFDYPLTVPKPYKPFYNSYK